MGLLSGSYLSALMVSAVTLCFAGELRFCHYGPQRILYSDCPGGFIAKRVLKTSCIYYYKPDNVPNMATIFNDDVCDGSKLRELDRDYQEFTEYEFQSVQFTDIEEADNSTLGADPAVDKCNETCLAEWVDPKYIDREPIFVDKPKLNDTETEILRLGYIERTKAILMAIVNEDGFGDDSEEVMSTVKVVPDATLIPAKKGKKINILAEPIKLAPMTGLMKLLAKSMRITFKKCEPFVEGSFYTLVFRTMQELRMMSENFPNVNIIPLKRIFSILDECEKDINDLFQLNGTECEDKFVVHTVTNLLNAESLKHKPSSNSFRWGRYDPIIEAAWSAVDFVHAFCFDHFATDVLHYSLYVKAMMDIFVQPIVEKHWMHPFPVGKGMTLWEMAYDTPDIINQLHNLDACVVGAYTSSVFDGRLERPFTTEEMMENPSFEEDLTIPTPGWTKSTREYWKMYDRRGFEEMVEEFGYCIKTPEEFAEKEMLVRTTYRC